MEKFGSNNWAVTLRREYRTEHDAMRAYTALSGLDATLGPRQEQKSQAAYQRPGTGSFWSGRTPPGWTPAWQAKAWLHATLFWASLLALCAVAVKHQLLG